MEAILGGQKTVDIGEYERATPDGYAEDHELKKILCFDFLGCLVSNAGENITQLRQMGLLLLLPGPRSRHQHGMSKKS